MKVRNKEYVRTSTYDVVYDVVEESANYYIASDGFGGAKALLKASWEPVPTERWVDVTAECEIVEGRIQHQYQDGYVLYCVHVINNRGVVCDRYRLRKGPCAIIVEKRESDERSQRKEST